MSPNRFSVRLGRDYRLVYSVYSHERLIDFEFVGDRKEAYRWIRRFWLRRPSAHPTHCTISASDPESFFVFSASLR